MSTAAGPPGGVGGSADVTGRTVGVDGQKDVSVEAADVADTAGTDQNICFDVLQKLG